MSWKAILEVSKIKTLRALSIKDKEPMRLGLEILRAKNKKPRGMKLEALRSKEPRYLRPSTKDYRV